MASVIGTFVPTYQGLSASHFVRPVVSGAPPFPFNVAHRLPYYRARNAIYHLFRALLEANPSLTVLAPDYYSGNEIMAIQAAGAKIHYCPVGADMQWDPAEVERVCRLYNPDLLYVIHYVGWPQPMAGADRPVPAPRDAAGRRLRALAPQRDGRWPRTRLVRTVVGLLSLQDAAASQRCAPRAERAAAGIAGAAEAAARRFGVGPRTHRRTGRAADSRPRPTASAPRCRWSNAAWVAPRAPWTCSARTSATSASTWTRWISPCRPCPNGSSNDWTSKTSAGAASRTIGSSSNSSIRTSFPCSPSCLPASARCFSRSSSRTRLWRPRRCASAVSMRWKFWNDAVGTGDEMSPNARFFRQHVLELPIHQDLSPRHIAHVARQVSSLNLRMVA